MSEHSNNSSSRIIIIIVVVVLVLGGAVGGWYFAVRKPAQEAEAARLTQEKAEEERLALEAQNKARYDQLMVEADSAFNGEDWQLAQSLYSEASSLFPDEQYPVDQLIIVNERLDASQIYDAELAPQSIERITQPLQQYYVIISSSLDDDLAVDHAQKLGQEGTQVKIIEHKVGEHLFFGLSVAEYSTFQDAAAATSTYSNLGEAWVLKW